MDNFVLVLAQLIEMPLTQRFGYSRVLRIPVRKF